MKIDNEISLDFDDVLLMPQRSTVDSRADIDIDREFKFYHSPRVWRGTPIMCTNMGFCSLNIADKMSENKMIAILHKYHSIDELAHYFNEKPYNIPYVWISIGYKNSELNKLLELNKKLKNNNIEQPNICIDVPHAHIDNFCSYCNNVRQNFQESIIMSGNITNPSSTQELIIHGGIDICRIGIGGGSACLSRMVTGCGVPQLQAIMDNSYIAHGQQSQPRHIGLICSDGGHKNPGDVCKAFCGGADFVCLGGYWAGATECDGEWEYEYQSKQGIWQNIPSIDPNIPSRKKTFTYYGMSSHYAQKIYEDSRKDYRASEGTKITVAHKGPIQNLINELLGGIRSCCSYIGATGIKDMSKCAHFCRVTKIHNNNNPIYGI